MKRCDESFANTRGGGAYKVWKATAYTNQMGLDTKTD
jgi:hypothetical protein